MFEWSEEQKMIRDAVRQFVEKEIAPHVDELEHGDTPPYDVLRKMFATFGMDVNGGRQLRPSHRQGGGGRGAQADHRGRRRRVSRRRRWRDDDAADHRDLSLLPRHDHGDGRERRAHRVGDHVEGHAAQKKRWAPRPAHAREGRVVGDHRTGFGIGRVRLDAVDGAARRRRVHPQRLEDVHHQRPVRRHHRVHLQARRRQRRPRSARC